MIDNAWPAVAPILQRAYHEKQRAYVASVAGHYAGLVPWPRRKNRRRPAPGVLDWSDPELG